MPIVTIKLLEGRSRQQKADLLRDVAAAVVNSLSVPPTAVRVLVEEVAPEHWSVGGISKAEPQLPGEGTRQTGDVS